MYGHTLEEDLKKEISGNFLNGVLALLTPTDEYEAQCLRSAIKVRFCTSKICAFRSFRTPPPDK
jgi:hypothetical protein